MSCMSGASWSMNCAAARSPMRAALPGNWWSEHSRLRCVAAVMCTLCSRAARS